MKLPYWRLSSFYFFYFATLGSFVPFWSLYLEHAGFSALEIGELTALMVVTKIIAPNIWGWLGDRRGKSLGIIRIASFLGALCFAGLFFGKGYWWIALITLSFSFFWHAALPQFETATLFHLKHDNHRYSQIRLWGSIGFIVAVTGIGYFLDYFSINFLPWMIVILLSSIWLATLVTPDVRARTSTHDALKIWQILGQPEIIAFFLVYLLLQLAHGPYYVFYSVNLSHHDYSKTLIGMLWALGVAAEIVLFVFIKPVLRWISLRALLLTSIFLSICRWLLIAHFPDTVGLVVFAQVLHAATYGGTHVAAIHLVQDYFGIHHQGKGQALYSSLCFGIGGVLGSLYSGIFWDSHGAEFVFAIAAAICCLAFLIAFIWVGRAKPGELG